MIEKGFDFGGWSDQTIFLEKAFQAGREVQREEEIHCPHCNGLYDFLEDAFEDGLVTCWGGDSDVELCCSHCDKIFYATEKVRRTFEISKGP